MKFRKKPIVIEAMQNIVGMAESITAWMADYCVTPRWENPALIIPTLEGDMKAERGDWIIKGVKNEFYPCKPEIFEATYEKVAN